MECSDPPVNPFPKPGWVATRGMLWLGYASISLAVYLLPPMNHQGFNSTNGVPGAGLPAGTVLAMIAAVLAVTGTIWMRRILQAGSEPETIDSHWWSRADLG